MLKQESTWSQACDTCHADSAYLCHEHVRVCESCERAPATIFCKADAASLCTACDSKVHSANPLARRHQRVPISSNSYGSIVTNHSSTTTMPTYLETGLVVGQEDEAEAASWLLTNSENNSGNNNNNNNSENNEYLQDYNVPQRSYGGDGGVPLQSKVQMRHELHDFQFGFTSVSSGAHKSSNDSPSHMVHLSSMDLRVVPEPTMSDTTVSKSVTQELPEPSAKRLSAVDREACVLRYREKKKMRKFEKTIRYASRKAYAEKRPRIKGRFVKRKEDQDFSTMSMFYSTGYGVVPSSF